MSFLFGLSSTYPLWIIFFSFNGLFQSTGWPCNLKLASSAIPSNTRGKSFGLWATNYQIGGGLATIVSTFLLVQYNWRYTFLVPGIFMVLWGLILFNLKDPLTKSESKTVYNFAIPKTYWNHIILLGGLYFFVKLFRYTILFWLPFYLNTVHQFDLLKSGWVSLFFEAGGVFGVILFGWLCDLYFKNDRKKLLPYLFLCLALVLYFFSINQSSDLSILLPSIFLIGCFVFAPDTLIASTLSVDIGGYNFAGKITGIINGIGSFGAALSGILSSWVAQQWGWSYVYLSFTLLAISMMVATLLANRFIIHPHKEETFIDL